MTRDEAAESIARNLELHEPEAAIRSVMKICQLASKVPILSEAERERWQRARHALGLALEAIEADEAHSMAQGEAARSGVNVAKPQGSFGSLGGNSSGLVSNGPNPSKANDVIPEASNVIDMTSGI